MNPGNEILYKINNHVKQEFIQTKEQLNILGIMLLVGYLGFYFLNSLIFITSNYENIYLRIIVTVLALPILFAKWLPKNIYNNYLHIHWYFTLMFCLPFFFIYMFLMNPTSNVWQINGLVGLTILTLFVGVISYIFLLTIGIIMALIMYIIVTKSFIIPDNFIGIFASYLPVIVFIIAFSTKQGKIYQEKLNAMTILSGIIAHEMNTPLAGIRLANFNIKQNINKFFGENKLPEEKNLLVLEKNQEIIEQLANGAILIINMMLTRIKQIDKYDLNQECSIVECINQALQQYPFLEGERELINFNDSYDFKFIGNYHLIIHILFNLIKNAIYYVRSVDKGNISISTKIGEKHNYLYFEDSGPGIPPKILKDLFKPFNSDTRHGTGLGLAFCKEVMEKINGQINCESQKDKYTKFTLNFPSI